MSKEEWGPWIDYDGAGCPSYAVGLYVQAKCAEPWDHGQIRDIVEGVVSGRNAQSSWHWGINGCTDVIVYRIRKPRGMVILEGLLENLPEEIGA